LRNWEIIVKQIASHAATSFEQAVIPDLIRNPVFSGIPAFAGMRCLTWLATLHVSSQFKKSFKGGYRV
jgi:hypothetical protein